MTDLNSAALSHLPPQLSWAGYDRDHLTPGIVHLSVGNFHRAHQAWYLNQVLAQPGHEGWAICGVGLMDTPAERFKARAFPEQDGLYTLSRFSPDGAATHEVIGAMTEYLYAPEQMEAVLERMAAPTTRIVSLTITEGGYNHAPGTGNYNLEAPVTQQELADPAHPLSAFGFIVEALRRRQAAGTPPFTVLSCDNLRHNGRVARDAVLTHARALDPALADWIASTTTFPNGMVDRITPGVPPEEVARLDAMTGIDDKLPVIAEDFGQWVIEDRFCNGRPSLEEVGVQMVGDVHPYELAKVRMLNASHSMLAYPGLLAGLETVSEALQQPEIRALLEQFLDRDVIPTLQAPAGMDLETYKQVLLARFANPTVGDQLSRITGDGGSKLPTFLGPTVAHALHRGTDTRRLAFGIACFARYLLGIDDKGRHFTPFEPQLSEEQIALTREADLSAVLRMSMFHDFGLGTGDHDFIEQVVAFRLDLRKRGAMAVLHDLVASE
jgi:mannitol-1-phosphate/altronate dehydrogenase